MKYKILFLVVLILAFCVFAQDDFGIPTILPKELIDVCNSAPPSGSNVLFNVDIVDTANDVGDVLPISSSNIHISTNGQSTWATYSMLLNGTADYENTYYYNWPSASNFHYYLQFATDSTLSTESPKYSGSGFPAANYWANLHDDPAGDDASITIEGSTYNWDNTDLRNFKMSYSDTRLYFEMTSNGGFNTSRSNTIRTCGSWLTWNQTLKMYHLYGAPIINPNAPYPDSIFYAVIYGDVDLTFLTIGITITPGVYKIVMPGSGAEISDYLDAYTKISSSTTFDHSISGNTLRMWFDKSILTSDSDFGDFPDDGVFVTGCGFITLAAWPKECGIMYVDIPDTFHYCVHDFSKNTAFYQRTHQDIVDINSIFTLDAESWTDLPLGFNINVGYTDPDNNVPVEARLEIGGCYPGIYDMTTPDHSYDDGSTFSAMFDMADVLKIPYRFIFDDGIATVTTDWDTINTGISTLDITVNGATTDDITLEAMDINQQYITVESESLHIENKGTIPIDLGVRVVSITDGTISFDTGNDPALNLFALRAIFNDDTTPPASSEFNPPENTISDMFTWADGASVFNGGGYSILPACYNGDVSAPDVVSEKLWLKIMTPTYASGMDGDADLDITVQVQAQAHLF